MTVGTIFQAIAGSIVLKITVGVLAAVVVAIRAAAWGKRLCAMLWYLFERYVDLADSFGKLGTAWQRLRKAWSNALQRWRKSSEETDDHDD
jgi:hypothetical protein